MTKRTLDDLRDSAFDAHGSAIHNSRRVDHNTLELDLFGGDTIIRHQDTDILTLHGDNKTFTVNLGGWNTVTTRDRLDKFLPRGEFGRWQVSTRKGIPYLTLS